MLRHFLVTSFRIMGANRLQSVIAVFGLSLGLAAAILDGLLLSNQLSFDHFIPGHDRLYITAISNGPRLSATTPDYTLDGPHDLAALIRQDVPQVGDVTRIVRWNGLRLRHGQIESKELVYWADANIFRLLPLPVLRGDLDKALERPDGIVISASIARKYFGRDDVVGQVIEIGRAHVMTVRAVIADLPLNGSNLENGIILSGKAEFSPIFMDDLKPPMGTDGKVNFGGWTLLRLKPGAAPEDVQNRIDGLVKARLRAVPGPPRNMRLIRLDRMHIAPNVMPLSPERDADGEARLGIYTLIASLVLFLACVNFVNISVARAARRGVEVGIRKAAGASRAMLAVQFLGEGIVQALLALCAAMMMVELSLPWINGFLQTGAVFDYWRDPSLMAALLAGAVLVGMLAGAYPAFVLSSFQPATILKGLTASVGRAGLIRQILVGLQFLILIGLIATSIIVFEQYHYAIRDALRVDTDQILFVRDKRCDGPFQDAVRALPGVRDTACSSLAGLPELVAAQELKPRQGKPRLSLHIVSVGYDLFELYGLSPVAGRFFARRHGGDAIPADVPPALMANYVINETAVRRMGFASPQAAIGQRVVFDEPPADPHPLPARDGSAGSKIGTGSRPRAREIIDGIVIGVVRDFSLFPSDAPVEPTAYSVGWPVIRFPYSDQLLHIKLRGREIPETLAAIDAAWRSSGADTPIERTFLDSYIQNLMINLARQGQAYSIFAGIATLLACLGLFALSIATAERRTKEIGIRKAMGASSTDIVLLLLWQFLKPVVAAGLIAVPLTWGLMQRWLAGYAYHVTPGPWPYLGAVAAAVLIATATVIAHAVLTARAVPATALRYE